MSVSSFVRYEGVAQGQAGFLRCYRLALHSPVASIDPFPVNSDRFNLLARMIFETQDDLDRALQSEARAEARADFAHFPPFEGNVYHQAVVSEEVFAL
jgi:hypothetical protein